MKIKKNKSEQEFFSEFLKSIRKNVKNFVRISTDITSQINYYLSEKNLTQRQLADRLGKKESEISKWLSGNHNFTIKTIANIEEAIGEEIISVPLFAKKEIKFIPYNSYSIQFNNMVTGDINFNPQDSNLEPEYNGQPILLLIHNSDGYGTTAFS